MRKRITTTYRIALPPSLEMDMQGNRQDPQDPQYGERLEPLRMVFLTDLHDKCRPEEAEQIIRAIEECRPDLILCGGDMILSLPEHPVSRVIGLLSRLAAAYPLYYALGNHECRIRTWPGYFPDPDTGEPCLYRRYRRRLEEAGVVFLENDDVKTVVKDVPLRICGLNLSRRYYRRLGGPMLSADAIRKVFGDPDPQEYTVLLAHTPRMMRAYQEWGADLTLCGHYHGGIMRLGKHRGLISPDLRLLPDNAYGLFKTGDKQVIVSAGCGAHTIPLRICNPREIVCCELYRDQREV